MKTIESSNDVKVCFSEINEHIKNNREIVKGEKEAELLLVISREIYDLRSTNLSYNDKCEFNMQCDSNSMTQLFEVH